MVPAGGPSLLEGLLVLLIVGLVYVLMCFSIHVVLLLAEWATRRRG